MPFFGKLCVGTLFYPYVRVKLSGIRCLIDSTATPHASVNSDIYGGYYIPKGMTLLADTPSDLYLRCHHYAKCVVSRYMYTAWHSEANHITGQ